MTLIEDVIVTGARAFSAVERVEERGAVVSTVVAVIDRNEGARERLADASIAYRYVFEPRDLGLDSHGKE